MHLQSIQLVLLIGATQPQPGLELRAAVAAQELPTAPDLEYSTSEIPFDEDAPELVRKHRRRERVGRYLIFFPPKLAPPSSASLFILAVSSDWLICSEDRPTDTPDLQDRSCRGPPRIG